MARCPPPKPFVSWAEYRRQQELFVMRRSNQRTPRKRRPTAQASAQCAHCCKRDQLEAYCRTCGGLVHRKCEAEHRRVCMGYAEVRS